MNRLTKEIQLGDFASLKAEVEYAPGLCATRLSDYGIAVTKLKAYEDTGLDPEKVVAIKHTLMGLEIAKITAFEDIPIQRLQELAQADKDGRLVVLPVKEGTTIYRVRLNFDGDRYEIIEMNFDLARFRPEDFGRIVFKTREEAEAALKKREEAGNDTVR